MANMAFKIRSVKFNFLMNLLLTGSSILFPLITFPLVSRALLAEAYGAVGFANGVATWLSLIAMLGVSRYGIREVARVRDDPRALACTTREILIVTIASTLVVYAGFLASLFLVERFAASRTLFFVCGLAIVLNTLGVNWFFQGIEQYAYITVRGLVIKVVCLVGVVLLVHVPGDYLVYAALLVCANGVANLVNFAYMLHLLRAGEHDAAAAAPPEPPASAATAAGTPLHPARHIRPLLTFFVIVAAISVYTALDTVMLGFLSTDQQVGFYTADVQIKNALVAVVSALSGVLLPRASNLLARGERAEWLRIIRTALKWVLLFSVPVCVLGATLATPAMTFYAGAAFEGAGPALSILVLAVIPIGMSVIFCDEMMIPLGMEGRCSYIYLGAAVVDFALNLLLIPPLGALGAAISTACVELAIAVVEFAIVRPYLAGKK